MDMERSFIQMVILTKDFGKEVKWMDKEFLLKKESKRYKEIGREDNCK